MSVPLHQSNFTYADYLSLEASSNIKHEFLGGQIYAMAGGTPEHAALAAAAIGLLFAQLRGGNCRAYDADLRVRTPSGLATYPDITIICGHSERHEDDLQAVTNPTLIIEVLSRSTEDYDEGDKFEHYKTLASLKQYVLVSHRERSVEVWTRENDNRWRSAIMREGATAELLVGARLDVHELYEAAAEPRA
jgi:Uma2 family endonuclease